jgi:hypothetical protein
MYDTSESKALDQRAMKVMPGPNSNLPGYELIEPLYIKKALGSANAFFCCRRIG